MIKGFREFLLRGNVVDLAIAVVIGTAFGAVVKAFVADILTPLIAAIFGKPNFGGLAFTINKSEFMYGDLLNTLISFISVAAAVYFFVVVPLNKLAEAKARRRAAGEPDEDVAEMSDEVLLLTEIRDSLRRREQA